MTDLHHVVVLAVPNTLLLDLAAPTQFFGELGAGRYRFELAGTMPGPIPTSTGFPVVAERGLEALADADTVVVPGVSDWDTASYPKAAAALADAHERGARIMSICTGAFLLGEAGLLDGRRVTTHWFAAEVLAQRYPSATVEPDVLYIDEGSVLTSAGVGAGLDLCMHVVRSDHGAAVAAEFARWTVIAPHREGGQAQFVPGGASYGRGASDSTIEPARTWALQHLDRPLTVTQLARQVAMSRRTFARRFVAETGATPAQWLLEQRLRAAQRMLETTDESVDRIAHRCGFSTPAAMRAHFRRRLHTTPTGYRRNWA